MKLLNPIFWVIGGRSQGSSRRLWRKRVEKCTNWKEVREMEEENYLEISF